MWYIILKIILKNKINNIKILTGGVPLFLSLGRGGTVGGEISISTAGGAT